MFGVAVYGSINRKPGTVPTGLKATWSTYLDQLICRAFFGPVLQPVNQLEAMQEMGIQGNVNQIRQVDADWPLVLVAGHRVPYNADDWPVKPGDEFVLGASKYSVKGVKVYPPDGLTAGRIILFVEVPA